MLPAKSPTKRHGVLLRLDARGPICGLPRSVAVFGGSGVMLLILLALILGLSIGLTNSGQSLSTAVTGDLTYYNPGLGACGVTSSDSDLIVALSHILFDKSASAGNPNRNPLCGRRIRAVRDAHSVDLVVVDRCRTFLRVLADYRRGMSDQ